MSLCSIAYALRRRERGDGLLAAFALPYYVLIGLVVVRYARYTIPLLPILALWTGRLLADLSRLPHPVWRRVSLGAGAAILAFTLVDAAWLVKAMAEPDPRDRALAWLDAPRARPHPPSALPPSPGSTPRRSALGSARRCPACGRRRRHLRPSRAPSTTGIGTFLSCRMCRMSS